jgi:hypothetical protein
VDTEKEVPRFWLFLRTLGKAQQLAPRVGASTDLPTWQQEEVSAPPKRAFERNLRIFLRDTALERFYCAF